MPLRTQREFWDRWNGNWRRGQLDHLMRRQLDTAIACSERENLHQARILDVGCGTGWLANGLTGFGRVTGTDLSPRAIREGKGRFPSVELICGDFLTSELAGPFDLVVSADVIAHVYDRTAFVERVAELLRPGGVFLLMTQNPWVWRRKSSLRPAQEGQLRVWPTLGQLRTLLAARFEIEHISSIVPGGDQGLLWWVENPYVRVGARLLMGKRRWGALLERALVGRELVVCARRMRAW